jgi:S1-C subfamily serine protease
MEDAILLDAVERYLNGEMNLQEKSYFEELRKSNAEVDQLVVEHQFFLSKLNNFGDQKTFRSNLQAIHNHLLEQGAINQAVPKQGIKVVQFWNKYKKTIAVAASIACITALTISGMTSYFKPNSPTADIVKLSREINTLKVQQSNQSEKISEITSHIKIPTEQRQRSAGSSFLIDPKGYLVTNAHVVNNASTLIVVNNGKEYYAKNIYSDPITDVAILKIDDSDFTPLPSLPYTIRKSKVDLGEEIFTLGYPRNEIVYGKGYMSAASGFNDDTLSVQISVDVNRGNSGGPVLDKNGDVMGILNSLESNANNVVFANRTNNIMNALTKLKEQDTTYRNIKLPTANSLKGKERTQQIKQISDCVFMVKGYAKQ